VFAISMSKRCI